MLFLLPLFLRKELRLESIFVLLLKYYDLQEAMLLLDIYKSSKNIEYFLAIYAKFCDKFILKFGDQRFKKVSCNMFRKLTKKKPKQSIFWDSVIP